MKERASNIKLTGDIEYARLDDAKGRWPSRTIKGSREAPRIGTVSRDPLRVEALASLLQGAKERDQIRLLG